MRIPHYLAENKGSELPHSAVWVDTETDQIQIDPLTVKHVLRFGWACYQRTRAAGSWCEPEWFRFTSAVDFWTWLESKARPKLRLFLFAHNWSFDAPVLGMFDILPDRGWRLTKAVIEGPPVIINWRRESTTIAVLDTLNWWRMPLRKVGESVGMPKLEMPALTDSAEEWDTYAKRDVEVIRVAVRGWWSFLAEHDLGGFAPTLAAQALRSYRHRYMADKILIDADADAIALARSALHGGRTEAFRIGNIKGPIECFDVNSMYPAVMASEFYPARLLEVIKNVDHEDLADWITRFCVVARVDIDTKRNRYAHLQGGRLVFPTGRFTESLTTPDIADALAHGEIARIHSVAVYDRSRLFANFVQDFYAHRRKAADAGNHSDSWRFKILMNSLYGKFAQRGERWEVIGEARDNDVMIWVEVNAQTGACRYFRKLSGVEQERIREGESHDSHPAIAAHVTAFGRARLWQLIQQTGRHNVYYVDTDSIYTNKKGAALLADQISPSSLGGIKSEGVFSHMFIYGPKDYVLDGKIVCKGVRSSAVWVSPDEVCQDQWTTLRGSLALGDLSAPRTRRVTKRLARIYQKGAVDDAGIVSPFVLREW